MIIPNYYLSIVGKGCELLQPLDIYTIYSAILCVWLVEQQFLNQKLIAFYVSILLFAFVKKLYRKKYATRCLRRVPEGRICSCLVHSSDIKLFADLLTTRWARNSELLLSVSPSSSLLQTQYHYTSIVFLEHSLCCIVFGNQAILTFFSLAYTISLI
jgi:hypothetical protein